MAITAAGILIGSNLILRPLARKLNPITVGDESEKQYRISVICQANAEQEIRLLLINSNSCKTLYLNHLESGDVVGDKVEIVAEYCSSGKPKSLKKADLLEIALLLKKLKRLLKKLWLKLNLLGFYSCQL